MSSLIWQHKLFKVLSWDPETVFTKLYWIPGFDFENVISFIIKWERAILFWKLILIGWKHSMRKIWPAFKYSFKATSPKHLNEYFNKSRPWFCFTDEIKIYQTFYWPVICMIERNSKWEVIDCPCEWYIKKPFLHQDEDLPWFSYMTSNVSLLIHLNNTLAYISYRRGHKTKETSFRNSKQGWNPWVKIKIKGESGRTALRNTGEEFR